MSNKSHVSAGEMYSTMKYEQCTEEHFSFSLDVNRPLFTNRLYAQQRFTFSFLLTNRKSYMSFRLAPRLMTLDDLELL